MDNGGPVIDVTKNADVDIWNTQRLEVWDANHFVINAWGAIINSPHPQCSMHWRDTDGMFSDIYRINKTLRNIYKAPDMYGLYNLMKYLAEKADRHGWGCPTALSIVSESFYIFRRLSFDVRVEFWPRKFKDPIAVGIAWWYYFVVNHFWLRQAMFLDRWRISNDDIVLVKRLIEMYERCATMLFQFAVQTPEDFELCVITSGGFNQTITVPLSSWIVADWEWIKERNLNEFDYEFND